MTQYDFADPRLLHRAALAAGGWLSALGVQIRVWAVTSADYYTAAARYEQLSRLCDAELVRRRLSRATLAWDLCRPATEPTTDGWSSTRR